MTDRGLVAIARWGAHLRVARQRRRSLVRRAILLAALAGALGATLAKPPRPLLVWNASPSAPVGLYAVSSREGLLAGDMVIARVPEQWRLFAARRHYIPANVPLVKRVAAVAGDRVCAFESGLWIDGGQAVRRHHADGAGRPMPLWSGCATLRAGTILLLMDAPDSFDGRYFGVTRESDVVGRAVPLWTR